MMAGAPPTPAGRHGSTGRASGAGGRGAERDDGKAAEVARVKEEQAKQTWALRHTPPPYHAWCHANISAEAKQWRLAIEAQFKILRQTSKTPAEHESARKEIARIKEIALKYKQGAFGMTLYFKRFGGFIIALIGALQKGTLLGDSQYRAHYVTGKIPAMLKA